MSAVSGDVPLAIRRQAHARAAVPESKHAGATGDEGAMADLAGGGRREPRSTPRRQRRRDVTAAMMSSGKLDFSNLPLEKEPSDASDLVSAANALSVQMPAAGAESQRSGQD